MNQMNQVAKTTFSKKLSANAPSLLDQVVANPVKAVPERTALVRTDTLVEATCGCGSGYWDEGDFKRVSTRNGKLQLDPPVKGIRYVIEFD